MWYNSYNKATSGIWSHTSWESSHNFAFRNWQTGQFQKIQETFKGTALGSTDGPCPCPVLLTITGVSEHAGRLQSMPNGSRTLTFGDRQDDSGQWSDLCSGGSHSPNIELCSPACCRKWFCAPRNVHVGRNQWRFSADTSNLDIGPWGLCPLEKRTRPTVAMLEEFRKWKQNCNNLDFYYSILLMKKSCTTWDV